MGIISFSIGVPLIITQIQYHRQWSNIVPFAETHDEISLDKMSREFGFSTSKVRKIVSTAISEGKLHGILRDDLYIQKHGMMSTHSRVESTTDEAKVTGTRKIPETCFKCGASIKPDSVTWVGPDKIECPHCGASLKIMND
jgi:predicted RNA-binding Zn-ribbon protein involved in translation (DUF1610 family)